MRKARSWFVTGMLLLFALGALNRILIDKNAPKLIRSVLDTLASLFSKTINS